MAHNKVHRLMRSISIEGDILRRKKKFTFRDAEYRIYPYALHVFENDEGQIVIFHANQVWSGDITYIFISGRFIYLTTYIIGWHFRAILIWKFLNTMVASLVTELFEEAIDKHSTPGIFNSDQGCQYYMGKGRSIDNVVIEWFFRILKDEETYLKEYEKY